jgi:hypothetical protein
MTDKPRFEIVDAVSDDPFDLANLRVSQDFLENTVAKKLLTPCQSGSLVRKILCASTHRLLTVNFLG